MKTTPEMRSRLRELSAVDGRDDYDRCVLDLLDDFSALSSPAPEPIAEAVAIAAIKSALAELHEGLTAALPQDERGWLLRRRFEAARDILEKALATPPSPKPEAVGDDWLRNTAMNVMLATEVDEAVRILSAALSTDGEQS